MRLPVPIQECLALISAMASDSFPDVWALRSNNDGSGSQRPSTHSETWIEFLVPGAGLAHPQLLLAFEEWVSQWMRTISVSLSIKNKSNSFHLLG